MRRRLLNDICQIEFVNKIDTVEGDVCIVDNNTLDKYFITSDSIECLNYDLYTPIGIVVVPASHTDDGTAKIVSLRVMSKETPNTGSQITYSTESLRFGDTEYPLNNYSYHYYYPFINDGSSEFDTIQTIKGWDRNSNDGSSVLSSDITIGVQNPYDVLSSYYNEFSDNRLRVPSPYLNDGNKNPIYHSTENSGNMYSDMDGKGNTKIILDIDNSNSTDWQTASTIQNIDDNQYIHPAAQCCWRYHTFGTNQGDWYLPSIGELGYLVCRIGNIKNSLDKFSKIGVGFNYLYHQRSFWSSTLYTNRSYTMYIFFTDEENFGTYHSRTFYSYNAWLYHAISFCSI